MQFASMCKLNMDRRICQKADPRGLFPMPDVEYMRNGVQTSGWKWLWMSFMATLLYFSAQLNKADKEENGATLLLEINCSECL